MLKAAPVATTRQKAKFLAGHHDFWYDHAAVVAQYTRLQSSLCTLSLWSRGLKERPYQCPPGPTPPWESVSSGVKAGGKVKFGRSRRGRRQRSKGKKKNEKRGTRSREKIETEMSKSRQGGVDRGCSDNFHFRTAKLILYHHHLHQCERIRRLIITCCFFLCLQFIKFYSATRNRRLAPSMACAVCIVQAQRKISSWCGQSM